MQFVEKSTDGTINGFLFQNNDVVLMLSFGPLATDTVAAQLSPPSMGGCVCEQREIGVSDLQRKSLGHCWRCPPCQMMNDSIWHGSSMSPIFCSLVPCFTGPTLDRLEPETSPWEPMVPYIEWCPASCECPELTPYLPGANG